MFESDARPFLFFADLLAANRRIDQALATVEFTVDLRRLYDDAVTEAKLRERYGTVWESR